MFKLHLCLAAAVAAVACAAGVAAPASAADASRCLASMNKQETSTGISWRFVSKCDQAIRVVVCFRPTAGAAAELKAVDIAPRKSGDLAIAKPVAKTGIAACYANDTCAPAC